MKTKIQIQSMALVMALAMGLSACGGNSSEDNAAAEVASSGAPAGSSASGAVTPAPAPSPGPAPSTGGSQALITLSINDGVGPIKTSSTYITKNIGFSNSASVGIDQSLRVQVLFGDPLPNASTGHTFTYTKQRIDVTLLVDGVARDTKTVNVSAGSPAIADFSEAVNLYIYQKGSKYVSLRLSNLRTDYNLLSGLCIRSYNDCCSEYDWYGTRVNVCYPGSSRHHTCSNNYNTCVSQNDPVGNHWSAGRWSMTFKVETDITQRIP